MDFVDGVTLRERMHGKQHSPLEAYQLLKPITEAFKAAHKKSVIHCDLKPENIIINRADDGKLIVKLLDFGIAKIQYDVERVLHHMIEEDILVNILAGTPDYMSLEQWEGRAEIDERTDIYSLAIIFYELITGKSLFPSTNTFALCMEYHQFTPPDLDKIVELKVRVPDAFGAAIAHAMAKQRSNRQQTITEFIDQLQAALSEKI